MLKIKLFAVAAFLAFAAAAFLFPNLRVEAQSSENAKKREEILEQVAGYKTWKQVQKPAEEPAEKPENGAVPNVLDVNSLSIGG